jgi:hypothetical protein
VTSEPSFFFRSRFSIERNYTQVPNAVLRDTGLFGNASSLYSLLMSHDPSFPLTQESVRAQTGLGRDAFRAARAKLVDAGLLRIVKITQPRGAVDANGRGIAGQVIRYDFELLEPGQLTSEPHPTAPEEELPEDVSPVENVSDYHDSDEGPMPPDDKKAWSKPVTGNPPPAYPPPAHPPAANPSLKKTILKKTNSSSSTEVTTDAPSAVSGAAAAPPEDDDEGSSHRVGGVASGVADDGLGKWRPVPRTAATVRDEVSVEPPISHAVAAPSGAFRAADVTEAGAERESEPLDVQQLFWAGVEMSLRDVDSRLDLSQIRRRLTDAGIDESRVDVLAAASFVLAAAARPVGDPSAYVAAAIIREPARWPWVPVAVSGRGPAPRQSMCELEGHRYVDEYRMQCVRCGEERQGWRDERYAAEQAQAAVDETAPRRAVAS